MNPAIVLFMNGIGTLLFILITKGKAPAYLGSSFAFIAPATIVIKNWGYQYALGGFVVSRRVRLRPRAPHLQVRHGLDQTSFCRPQPWARSLR